MCVYCTMYMYIVHVHNVHNVHVHVHCVHVECDKMCKKGLYPQKKFNSRYSTIYYRKSMKMAVRKSIIMLFRYQSLLVFSVKQAFKVHVQCMYLITSKVRILKEYFSFSRNLCTKMSCPTPLLQYQSCSANIFCCQIFV